MTVWHTNISNNYIFSGNLFLLDFIWWFSMEKNFKRFGLLLHL